MMLMEYRIANKINTLLRRNQDDKMNNILIHSDNDKVVHVIKEINLVEGWHKRIISIGIADKESPQNVSRASFHSKEKLKMLIATLQSHLEEME